MENSEENLNIFKDYLKYYGNPDSIDKVHYDENGDIVDDEGGAYRVLSEYEINTAKLDYSNQIAESIKDELIRLCNINGQSGITSYIDVDNNAIYDDMCTDDMLPDILGVHEILDDDYEYKGFYYTICRL